MSLEPTRDAEVGRLRAELADLRLRLRESQDRELILAGTARRAEQARDQALAQVLDRQREVERFAGYVHAVHRSLPWRTLQRLRRLVGREW